MPKAHILLAHPEPKSFNGDLARLGRATLEGAGWQVSLSDLCAEGFDAVEGPQHYSSRADASRFHAQTEQRHHAEAGETPSEVQREQDKLLAADLLVVHFPLWWFGAPAILKGWMDRVFVYGALYSGSMRYDKGRCAGKRMISCITTGASADSCAHDGREGDTRLFAWPVLFPFRYIGFEVLKPAIFHGIGGVASIEAGEDGLSATERYAQDWRETLERIDSRSAVPFNSDADFDESKRLRSDALEVSPFVSHKPQLDW